MSTNLNPLWVSLDLEMDHDKDGNLDNIIQIGAVVFNPISEEIIQKIDILVKLPDGKKLTPFISKLTGITDEMLEKEGRSSIYLAYKELEFYLDRYDLYPKPLSWGGNDFLYLKKQLIEKASYKEGFLFRDSYVEVKDLYQAYCLSQGKPLKSGMAKSMNRIGLTFKGKVHNALADAYNLARIYCALIKKMK